MSSLDSALNSLSAATVHDFIAPRIKDKDRLLLVSKLTTVGWGVLITGFAFVVGDISGTVIESINKIGSAFAGPILAAFAVGVLSKNVTAKSIIAGILCGVGFNLFLWMSMPGVFWMWWNLFGFIVAVGVSFLAGFASAPTSKDISGYVLRGSDLIRAERRWISTYIILVIYFILMLIFLLML